jgi:hypothetical protein
MEALTGHIALQTRRARDSFSSNQTKIESELDLIADSEWCIMDGMDLGELTVTAASLDRGPNYFPAFHELPRPW